MELVSVERSKVSGRAMILVQIFSLQEQEM